MKNGLIALMGLMLVFAVIAVVAPEYTRAALGMAIGALAYPVAEKMISTVRGTDA